MEMQEKPKRPLSPFFLYREKEGSKGNRMGGSEAAERWRSMKEEEKAVYLEMYKKARAEYDEYLASQGLPSKISSKKKNKNIKYFPSRIKTICEKIKCNNKVYKGLSRAAECFVRDLSKIVGELMKSEERRTITVDLIAKALEEPKYDFLDKMEEFGSIVVEAEKAVEDEYERKSLARKPDEENTEKKSAKKKKSRKRNTKKKNKDEDSDEDSNN